MLVRGSRLDRRVAVSSLGRRRRGGRTAAGCDPQSPRPSDRGSHARRTHAVAETDRRLRSPISHARGRNRSEDRQRLMLEPIVAALITGGTRFLTGAKSRWLGCGPESTQRIYFANHSSHVDFVLLWASLPRKLRAKTRPVAAAD